MFLCVREGIKNVGYGFPFVGERAVETRHALSGKREGIKNIKHALSVKQTFYVKIRHALSVKQTFYVKIRHALSVKQTFYVKTRHTLSLRGTDLRDDVRVYLFTNYYIHDTNR